MPDRTLLESFDAALPRLDTYPPRSVPAAGHKEFHTYQERAKERRGELGLPAAAWFTSDRRRHL
jgi:hypothetical protein